MIDVLGLLREVQQNTNASTDRVYARQDKLRNNAIEDFKIGQAVDQQNFQRWDRQQDNARADQYLGFQKQNQGIALDRFEFEKQYRDEEQRLKFDAARKQAEVSSIRMKQANLEYDTALNDSRLTTEIFDGTSNVLNELEMMTKGAGELFRTPNPGDQGPEDPRVVQQRATTLNSIQETMASLDASLSTMEKSPARDRLASRLATIKNNFNVKPPVQKYLRAVELNKERVAQYQTLDQLSVAYQNNPVLESLKAKLARQATPLNPMVVQAALKRVESEEKISQAIRQSEAIAAARNGTAAATPGAAAPAPSAGVAKKYASPDFSFLEPMTDGQAQQIGADGLPVSAPGDSVDQMSIDDLLLPFGQ